MAPKKLKGSSSKGSSSSQMPDEEDRDIQTHPGRHNYFRDTHLGGRWIFMQALYKVMDQGMCNCCVACVVAGIVAARYFLEMFRMGHAVELPILSIQELVDCIDCKTADEDDVGCLFLTFEHLIRYLRRDGVFEASNYGDGSYKERRGKCLCDEEPRGKGKGKGKGKKKDLKGRKMFTGDWIQVSGNKIIEALEQGPLAAMAFVVPTFVDQFRTQSLYTPPHDLPRRLADGQEVLRYQGHIVRLHAVMVVDWGWNPDQRTKFYVVQSSYGADWGYCGFAKVHENALHAFRYPTDPHFRD